VDGKCELLFFDRKDGVWMPIKKALEPVVGYSGCGTSLSGAQMKKLAKKMGK